MQGARVCFQPPEPFPAEVADEVIHKEEHHWRLPESADVVRQEDVPLKQQRQRDVAEEFDDDENFVWQGSRWVPITQAKCVDSEGRDPLYVRDASLALFGQPECAHRLELL